MKRLLIYIPSFIFLYSCSSGDTKNKVVATKTTREYRLATIEQAGVASSIRLPAQLAAYQQVSIFPKVNAYVKTVSVDIGDKVKEGQLLMTLEAPELQQATLQARERYVRAMADFSLDKERYQRLLEADRTPGAISALDISTIRAKMDADSALSNAERSNWQMQQQMQTYLTVTAPFSGVITDRNVYPGALVSAVEKDKPMLELKEIARLRLRVDVPEALASTLKVQDTISFYTSALPGKRITGHISRRSMNVDPQFRLERVEIDVDNPTAMLSPGMYADVILYSKGNSTALSVPTRAVITSTERKYLWEVRNGKAVSVDVTTGNSTNGHTEVFGDLTAGQRVVSNPDDNLREGQALE